MSDFALGQLHSDVQAAKAKLMAVVNSNQSWPCSHCGHLRTHPANEVWDLRDLREAAGVDGPASMIAVNALVDERKLAFDSRWRVFVPPPATRESAA